MSKKDDYFSVMKNTNELFMFFKGIFEKNKCKIIKKMNGKPVREDYIPFNEMPEMYDALYK